MPGCQPAVRENETLPASQPDILEWADKSAQALEAHHVLDDGIAQQDIRCSADWKTKRGMVHGPRYLAQGVYKAGCTLNHASSFWPKVSMAGCCHSAISGKERFQNGATCQNSARVNSRSLQCSSGAHCTLLAVAVLLACTHPAAEQHKDAARRCTLIASGNAVEQQHAGCNIAQFQCAQEASKGLARHGWLIPMQTPQCWILAAFVSTCWIFTSTSFASGKMASAIPLNSGKSAGLSSG